MCGIVGIADFQNSIADYQNNIQSAIKELSKRGPDYQSYIIDNNVALGHARLAIIDTSAKANQPFSDLSGNFTIVFNGEIYNFRELRQQLQKHGFVFRTESDTEVVLYAFIHWGIACLQYLNGDFAFAIYDKSKNELTIARDRFGIKPLVYYYHQGQFIFSSEIKGILPFLKQSLSISSDALELYLRLNYIPSPYTIYNEIKKLEPAHYLIFSSKGISKQHYYSIPFEENDKVYNEQTIFKKFKQLFTDAVQRRLIADVPLGTFLSGGIDSSIITAIAKQYKPNLETFTILFQENSFLDESKDAEKVAHYLGTNHHTIPVSHKMLLDNIYDLLEYIDEPFADSSAIAVSALARYTRQHIVVALSGDGADELYGGYNKHKAHQWVIQNYRYRKIIDLLDYLLKVFPSSRKNFFSNKIRQIHKLNEGLKLSAEYRYWHWASFMTEPQIKKLLNHIHYSPEHWIKTLLPTPAYTLNDILYNDMHLVLPNDMLFKTDSMSMMHSLEARVPMLDHETVNFVVSLPSHYKIRNGSQKYILKQVFGNLLPKETLLKPKHGFEVPMQQWLQNDLNFLISQYLSKEALTKHNLFNINSVNNLIAQLRSFNPADSAFHLWNLIVFQYWYINKYR
ncbi:MAG: asparagine synthase (glutamine-hydrolyzing) [Bacteroidales bacterium]|nr:asparagine synthase (glutamine-hydrolyzing) [Bacteroidales bacterium]